MRDDVVSIGGRNEARNGQTNAFSEDARGEIAEITTGDGDDERNRSDRQLAICGDMIKHLRKQAAHVDGICGREKRALIELLVGEGLLDQTLAVVESALDFESSDVLTKCGELLLLGGANPFGRIKNHDADAGDAEKSVSDGAAGVPRSGDKDGERARFAADEITHETRHESRAEILEGERGAVEKLENVESR